MKTVTKTLYLLSELSEATQQTAHQNYINAGWNHFDSACIIEDVKAIMLTLGVEVHNVYFSGFSSQGDGACFEGEIYAYPAGGLKTLKADRPQAEELHKLAKAYVNAQAANFYQVRGTIRQQGHYNHSGCTSFDLSLDSCRYVTPHNEQVVIDALRALMDYAYTCLEEEFEYGCSFEAFKEACEANEWYWTETGEME